jgi:hypothetical protein
LKSNRQRRGEITLRRAKKRLAATIAKAADQRTHRLAGQVRVNPANLKPSGSYGVPDFVAREFYEDRAFQCKDCGKDEVWTATQQKWWYEVAQGDVWTRAVRCRACRRKEAARKAAAREVHVAGLARKHARRP